MSRTPGVAVGPPQTATVVLVGFSQHELDFLQELFDCQYAHAETDCTWVFQPRGSVQTVLSTLKRDQVPVILCNQDSAPGVWKELLNRFELLSQPPCLIVTSRLADDYLWAEALNLGAYDVLARPFDRSEVVRTLCQARLHWQYKSNGHPAVMRTVA